MTDIPNPIKLLNEWRDTAYYTCAVGTTVALVVVSGFSLPMAVATCGMFVAAREGVRALAWRNNFGRMQLVGGKSVNVSKASRSAAAVACAGAAAATGSFLGMIFTTSASLKTPFAWAFIGKVTAATLAYSTMSCFLGQQAGGVKEIFRLYKDLLFDYPRKKDGDGGTTETQKVAGLFQAVVDSIAAPHPRPSRALAKCAPAATQLVAA